MALNYGLGLYTAEEKKKKAFTKFYKEKIKPNESLNNFYHGALCWHLMIVDVGSVTEFTIPIIANRMKECYDAFDEVEEKIEKAFKMTYEELLKKYFIGYQINVNTMTTADYIKKRMRILKNSLLALTEKEIEIDYKKRGF